MTILRLISLTLLLAGAFARTFASNPDSIGQPPVKAAPIVARAGTSAVVNFAMTELFKSTIHETRPDRSGHHSWPSRHSSWAFTAASVVGHELYVRSPWWALGAHAVADCVAMQRVLSRRHYPKDVIGGAAIGLISTEIGYAVGRLLYPHSYPRLPYAVADWMPALDVSTQMIVPFGGPAGGVTTGIGASTALRLSMPVTDWWGVAVSGSLRSLPVRRAGLPVDMLSSVGLSAGFAGWLPLGTGRWAAQTHVMPGIARNFGTDNVSHPSCSFTLDITGGFNCQLTDRFVVGADLGYMYWALRRGVSALTLGIYTRAQF
ncbi:MAG: phosphatase PAP2 family protein [Bacteroidales bacterium]|nr:phosphatase PAP2 family protein [Bacteroidales bacterium]